MEYFEHLENEESWGEYYELSNEQPVLLFKHSTT